MAGDRNCFRIYSANNPQVTFSSLQDMLNNTETMDDYLQGIPFSVSPYTTEVYSDVFRVYQSGGLNNYTDLMNNTKKMKFAGFNSTYHKLNPPSGIGNFYIGLPNNAITNGFSPLVKARTPEYRHPEFNQVVVDSTYSYSVKTTAVHTLIGKTYLWYKNNGKGARGTGILELRLSDGMVMERYDNCPSCIIVGVQAAGGGGGKGGNNGNGQPGQGGSAGGFISTLIYMPYNKTEFTLVAIIENGAGGGIVIDNNAVEYGGKSGKDSIIYWPTSSGKCTVQGGYGGRGGKTRTNSQYYYSGVAWFGSRNIVNNYTFGTDGQNSRIYEIGAKQTIVENNIYSANDSISSSETAGMISRSYEYVYYSGGVGRRKFTKLYSLPQISDGYNANNHIDKIYKFVTRNDTGSDGGTGGYSYYGQLGATYREEFGNFAGYGSGGTGGSQGLGNGTEGGSGCFVIYW